MVLEFFKLFNITPRNSYRELYTGPKDTTLLERQLVVNLARAHGQLRVIVIPKL